MTEEEIVREEMRKGIENGTLHVSTGPEVYEWTEEEKLKLKAALAKMFGWKTEVKDGN